MSVQRAKLPDLVLTFLRIGARAFGGRGAALALIERELVDAPASGPRAPRSEGR